MLAGFSAQRLGDGGPDIGPHEYVAVGDVEDLVARRFSLPGPGDTARQQIGVDRLRHAADAARIIQSGLAGASLHRGIDAQGRDHIHGTAHGIAYDQHRPQD
jgi:hypothetical protein